MTELLGITWNHTRGYLPMVATAQRFSELYPGVIIRWEKRSLQQFADQSLQQLVGAFDLLVIDHPCIGIAAENSLLVALDQHLPPDFLDDQAAHSVGKSHESYRFDGHQWALAIDAATPVSGWRPDLLEHEQVSVPTTWSELLQLARRRLVAFPGIPIDLLMHFYMLCTGLGEPPFSTPDKLITSDLGVRALEMLRELAGLVCPECAQRNPIAVWEHLAMSDWVAFCPFAYGYSNYARNGYSERRLQMGGLVRIDGFAQCRSTLGGAGLAISSRCRQLGTALEYCRFVASPECQAGLYFQSGGQPGHRLAWLNTEVNRVSHNFFRNTLPTLDEAWLRPRWSGYLDFQEQAGVIVHQFVWQGGSARDAVFRLNQVIEQSMKTQVSVRSQ